MSHQDTLHETTGEQGEGTSEAPLRFLASPLLGRLFVGAPFAAAWMLAVLAPLLRRIESDLPLGLIAGALFVATVAPVLLYLRRHALDAFVRWNDRTVTLVRAGRIETSIAWADAIVRMQTDLRMPERTRVLQIADAVGRSITLATGSVPGGVNPSGRRRIDAAHLDALVAVAREHATFANEPPRRERSSMVARGVSALLFVGAVIALFSGQPPLAEPRVGAFAFAAVCAMLLLDPARRLVATLSRPSGRETLMIDTAERGRLRARRLDGSRVLLDVDRASHPDAMLSARRGFVHAVLAVPTDGTGTTYRSQEEPIPATFVETRDDRVLRFEHLRAALVDVIGYGTFFATAVAAVVTG